MTWWLPAAGNIWSCSGNTTSLPFRSAGAAHAGLLGSLGQVQHRIETSGAWQHHQRVKTVIARTDLDENAEFRLLSAGMKRRVFLARALASEPDVLLLDEPTNHLDITTILWLEKFLLKYEKTFMFVTHDRAFLARLATRIVEIDRGRLFSFACNYGTYLERRQALLEAEEKQAHEFDKKLAREETWIRKGVRARRTRNEGRARALMQMREERAAQAGAGRRLAAGHPGSGTERPDGRRCGGDLLFLGRQEDSGRLLHHYRPGRQGRHHRTQRLRQDDPPQVTARRPRAARGKVRLGSGVKIAYFDQLREQLDENKTLRENIADGNDTIITGDGSRHVVGYLQDFLFSPEPDHVARPYPLRR